MRLTASVLFLVLFCSLTAAAQTTKKSDHTPNSPPAATETTPPAMSDADVQALRADIAKMKIIVEQMRSNLANVSTLQDPLKHQFQLEIDMWNVVIGDMQRKLDAAEKK